MRIKQLKIGNLRGYEKKIVVHLSNLTVFVGKNDVGKSAILEALDIFYNEGKTPEIIKVDKEDVNEHCRKNGDTEIKISVVFENLPKSLTIDSTNPTTLKDEFLLKQDGTLEILKKYSNGGKEKVFVIANHTTNPNCSNLLLKNNAKPIFNNSNTDQSKSIKRL